MVEAPLFVLTLPRRLLCQTHPSFPNSLLLIGAEVSDGNELLWSLPPEKSGDQILSLTGTDVMREYKPALLPDWTDGMTLVIENTTLSLVHHQYVDLLSSLKVTFFCLEATFQLLRV